MKTYFCLILFLVAALAGVAQSDDTSTDSPNGERSAEQTGIKIFPNPATNVVNVLGLDNTAEADITIMDIYGKTVLRHRWAIRRNALNIPIPTLEPGAYIIQIRSEEQQVRTKFYKQ